MTETLARRAPDRAATIEQVLIAGDLSALSPEQRVAYYRQVCESLGLNYLTRPFDYIVLNGRLTLYAKKDATDQLRRLHQVSVTKIEQTMHGDSIFTVTAYGKDGEGRVDSATGAVYIKNLGGEALANAFMRCETKAKRRLTLSLCGLGWTDESEIDSIPEAQPIAVDPNTGEVLEEKPAPKRIMDRPAEAAPRRERTVEELLQAYDARLEQAVKDGRVPADERVQWELPRDAGRTDIINQGQKLASLSIGMVRVGDPDAEELAALIQTAAAAEIPYEDCRVGLPAAGPIVKRAIEKLQVRIDEALAETAET